MKLSLIIIIFVYLQFVLTTLKKFLVNRDFQTLRFPILEIILIFILVITNNSYYILLFIFYLNDILKYLRLKIYYYFWQKPNNYYLILKFKNKVLIKHTIFLILIFLSLKLAIVFYLLKELVFLFDFSTDVQGYDILIASCNPGIVLTHHGRKKMYKYKLSMFFFRNKHEMLEMDHDYIFTDIIFHNKLKQEI